MISLYRFGSPFSTEAVQAHVEVSPGVPEFAEVSAEKGFRFTMQLTPEDIVYGLGGAGRGINKRGFEYISNCSDQPHHHEDTRSMYAAHNFLLLAGSVCRGLFFDYPAKLTFDIGFTRQDTLTVSCEEAGLDLYVLEGDSPLSIVKEFRSIIGRSYIPPKFAFGFGQSRWGYESAEDIRSVAREHVRAGVPLDMIYMDIDYMKDFRDFTVDPEKYPDFPGFVREMKQEYGIRLVPIIDAGVKIQSGDPVYEEGLEKGYFCTDESGKPFEAAVWPGYTHFPDVLNPEARRWFGEQYRALTDQGIEGFWNDMNEPAIFYSRQGLEEIRSRLRAEPEELDSFELNEMVQGLSNSPADYRRFYHNVKGQRIRHDRVHNLYGYNMTRAAGEAFDRLLPEKRVLLFSRSSYIGMHRYGGIWTGDNNSWWSHILLNLKMLPSLNMCGFLYVGADLGGFGCDTTRDLLLRWLALGVFTPLMRNHSCKGTRLQEFYRFEGPEDFTHVIGVRYRLLPYLYTTFLRCALENDMIFRPLGFCWPDDPVAVQAEDQLLLGDEAMIAPVYTQNASGRYVYLPEEMMLVKFLPDGSIFQKNMSAGLHYIPVALNEVPLFIRRGCAVPLAEAADRAEKTDFTSCRLIGWPGASFTLWDDDGFSKDPAAIRRFTLTLPEEF